MELTAEQREFCESLGADRTPKASGGQTPEQARSAFAFDFCPACQLRGVEVPSEEAVLAELAIERR